MVQDLNACFLKERGLCHVVPVALDKYIYRLGSPIVGTYHSDKRDASV